MEENKNCALMKKAILFILIYFISLNVYSLSVNLNDFITPETFGCVSNDRSKAINNANALQKALDYSSRTGKTILFNANARYYLGHGLIIRDFVNLDFNGSTLIATDTINVLTLLLPDTKRWNGCLSNCRIELDKIGKCGILCQQASKLRITNCEVASIGANAVGIKIDKGFEIFVDNSHFEGWDVNSTGIKIAISDCHFSDCVMIDCYTAVDNRGSNFFERIHAWMLPRYIQGRIYFRNRGGGVFLNQCFCDTYDKAFVVDNICDMHISQLKLIHNKIMWKEPYDKVNPVVFDFKDDDVANKSKISMFDSYIGGLWLGNKERQVLSKRNNHIVLTNSNVTAIKNPNETRN